MIPIYDLVLSDVIEERLKFIKNNIDIVDRVLPQATITLRTRLKEFIRSDKLSVVRGYPMDRASIPCYSILLAGEGEQEKVIGSAFSDESEDEGSYEVESMSKTCTVFKRDGKMIIEAPRKPIELVNAVETLDGEYTPYSVVNGRRGFIEVPEANIGDELTLTYAYRVTGEVLYGSLFNMQYRIETWTGNSDLTIVLYALLKWILLSSRDELEDRGISLQSLGGGDVEPMSELSPEFIFRRVLTFEFISLNSFDRSHGYIQEIEVEGKVTEND